MYSLRFEQENNINYMVIDADKEQEKTYDIKMLEKNKIAGFLPMQLRQINNQKMYYYNISSKQQLTQLFRYTSICWEDLKMICEGIAMLVKSVNEYMLDLNNVIISPEGIYADILNRELYFTYCPKNAEVYSYEYATDSSVLECDNSINNRLDNNFEKGLKSLFEYVLERFDHETEKSKLMQVYGLYQNIVQKNYNAENLWELVGNDEVDLCSEDTETIRIDDVPCENVSDEEEIVDNSLVHICKIVKGVSAVSAAAGLIRLLFPQFMPIKISSLTAVICIVCGAAAYLLIAKIPKASMTKLKRKTYKQPYEVEINHTSRTSSIIEGDLSDKGAYMDNVNLVNEGALMYEEIAETQKFSEEAEVEHTMLMSAYLESSRNKSICLRFIGDKNVLDFAEKDLCEYADLFECKDLCINKFPCIIGSLSDRCDTVIDNELISRVHACITMEEGYYYIEDMNSTNGTYVNESQVNGSCRQSINFGDEIRLAGFIYRLERG